MAIDQLATDQDRWAERGVRHMAAAFGHLAHAAGGRVEEWPEASVYDAASPCPFLNGIVLRDYLFAEAAPDLIGRLDRFFGARPGGSWLLWSLEPTPSLEPHGLNLWGHPPVMLRPTGGHMPSLPPGLEVVEVRDGRTLADFERLLVEGYPLPWLQPYRVGCVLDERVLETPLQFWVGYVDGEPVSGAGVLVEDGLIGVYWIATLPAARRKGYGTALTWQATLAAPELPAILEASDDGRPIYERMGYQPLRRLTLWERPRQPA